MTDPVLDIVRRFQTPPNPRVLTLTDLVSARHPEGSIAGFLFYGSGLREADDPEKMLDLYVLVRRYRAVHGKGMRAALNRLIPPNVYYLAAEGPDGRPLRSKYSILSLPEFERRAGSGFSSGVWGRFAQATGVLRPADEEAERRIFEGLSACVRTFAQEAEVLSPRKVGAEEFWTRALAASYRTELRAEDAEGRAAGIVAHDRERYHALMTALYGPPDAEDLHTLPDGPRPDRWRRRRVLGKPATVIRVLKAAFTFEGGVDYALHKLESHSGVRVEVTPSQRRHPVLWSPVLLWKVLRSGALR